MTQNITFEDWEAEQMRDPEFRAAVEKLETEYQNERSQMSQLEQRIKKLEVRATLNADEEQRLQVVANATVIGKLAERIRQLETCATINAETIGDVERLKVAMVEQGMRIEKLEAALETWLIAVNYDDAATPPMNEMRK